MRDGSAGKYGNPGNEESATYRLPDRPGGSNPTLTARIESWLTLFIGTTGLILPLSANLF